MCELIAAGEEGVQACALELAREGPSYTVETLEELRARNPHARWTFIAGSDTARTLPSWRRPAELLELAHLAVAARSGSSRDEVLAAIAEALAGVEGGSPDASSHVTFLRMPPLEMSSSQVRERVARGESVADLVGRELARYIAEQRLYAPDTGTPPPGGALDRAGA
jgi:nicotinate-nucleotide adenylyltransferase